VAATTKKPARPKRKTNAKATVKRPVRSSKAKPAGAAKASKPTRVAKPPRVAKATASRSKETTKQSAVKGKEKQSDVAPVDQRRPGERRTSADQRVKQVPVATERRKLQRRAAVSRRRQIDPTTCERDYTADEIAFMTALDEYKRKSGRMFPTCSEVLEVIRDLGYVKVASGTPALPSPADGAAPDAVLLESQA
jgi:hypothetical protein